MSIHLDADFKTNRQCEYHCYPSCHPAQINDDPVYGCTNKAWPGNRAGDFVPIVNCEGDPKKCEMKSKRFVSYYLGGLYRRKINAEKKIREWQKTIDEIEGLAK